MKNLLFFLILVSCGQSKLTHDNTKYENQIPLQIKDTISYKVFKIDSINSYYLIYARKGDSLYKIISKKDTIDNCNQIILYGEYNFNLHSILTNKITGQTEEQAQNSLLVNCFVFDKQTTICLERDSINDLDYADNIKGLCFTEE